MGLKFTREYEDIISELVENVYIIDEFYDFFEMNKEDWFNLSESEQKSLTKTLSDDLFYALENETEIFLGKGIIKYDKLQSKIYILNSEKLIGTVSLV